MKIETLRFGTVEIDEKKLVNFKDGLPGLEDNHRFTILQFAESYPIRWLQSLDDSAICLPIIDSFAVAPDYAFDIGDEDVKDLELAGPEDVYIVSIVVIPEEQIDQMTVNLVAPVIMNVRTGKAKQIILSGGEYNVRHPIFTAVYKLIMDEEAQKQVKEDETDAGAVAENK